MAILAQEIALTYYNVNYIIIAHQENCVIKAQFKAKKQLCE